MMRGLTLVELLVVLVLTSLLMTLVVQGLGTVLVNLDRVASYQQDVNRGLLQNRWFITSVSAVVAHSSSERSFTGDEEGFTALTLEPLATASGIPTMMRWHLVPSSTGGLDVIYSEGDRISWRLASLPFSQAEFEYFSREQGWVGSWNQQDIRNEYIPRQVRLRRRDGEEDVFWLANLHNFHLPLIDYRNE